MEPSLEAIFTGLERILAVGCAAELLPVERAQTELSPEERARVASWAPHRQMEYAAGRICARRALEKVGFADRADLASDADGLPGWPEAYVGSISTVVVSRWRWPRRAQWCRFWVSIWKDKSPDGSSDQAGGAPARDSS